MTANDRAIEHFTGKLREILDHELAVGNTICEAYHGDWPYPNVYAIVLERPFSPPIHKNLDDIVFRNVNDPHYWKAEYYDRTNNLMLVCRFAGESSFDDL